MGDILIQLASRMLRWLRLWSCGDRASDLHQIPRLDHPSQRAWAESAPLRMDVAQFDVSITHQPVTAFGLADADRLTDQRLTDKDQLARPFDLAGVAHAAHRNFLAIVRMLDPIGIGPRRGLVQQSRRLLSQRLVRSLIVVDRAERAEPLLLRCQTGGWRRRRFLVERAVHPLVAPVLLAGVTVLGSQTGLNGACGELYPARMRTSGYGFATGVGRLGGIAPGPLGGFLLAKGLPPTYVFLSACVFAAMAAIATACPSVARPAADPNGGDGSGVVKSFVFDLLDTATNLGHFRRCPSRPRTHAHEAGLPRHKAPATYRTRRQALR
jgi:hypothetical protein